jgi:capsular exopolysaccharide synthesis family protein
VTLAGLLIGAALGFGAGVIVGPSYTTSMQFFVSTSNSDSTSDTFQGSQFAQERVASYAGALTGKELAARVVQRLDLDLAPEELAGKISASTVTGTVLLDVSVTDSSPARAEAIAQALTIEFPEFVADLENPRGDADSPVSITPTDRPGPAYAPSPSPAIRNAVFGGILGLLAGAALSVIRVLLDRSVKEQTDAEELAGAPVMGVVFRDAALTRRRTIDRADARTAEDYRQLRTNLQFLDVDNPPKVIMVTSSVPAEGKTTTVVNLAIALADAGRRVTVVEADLRRPKVTEYFELVDGVGLTNVLAGSAALEDVLQEFGEKGLRVLAAGPTPPNPSELLGSSQMAALLDKLRADNDYVLVDAAPLLPVADARGLAAHTDGVLLAVRHGSTRMEQLAETAAAVERVGARTLGVVLTMVPHTGDLASAHAHGYEYGYAAERVPQGPEVPVGQEPAPDRGGAVRVDRERPAPPPPARGLTKDDRVKSGKAPR